jgi:hypothetical protein
MRAHCAVCVAVGSCCTVVPAGRAAQWLRCSYLDNDAIHRRPGQAPACLADRGCAQQGSSQFHRTHHRIHAWRHPPILRALSCARDAGRKARQQNLALPISLRAVPHARGMRRNGAPRWLADSSMQAHSTQAFTQRRNVSAASAQTAHLLYQVLI